MIEPKLFPFFELELCSRGLTIKKGVKILDFWILLDLDLEPDFIILIRFV